ncbi:unnamed protein product [Clonostachys solani]|uniref:Amino acid transporter transmembrane domain-containing protein n=1 Tax=Clonostachys solani TaxID=160281 RepID=A0A9N9ZHB7_9HYPO|nr:unnamed protein product [Clonostachys solani]
MAKPSLNDFDRAERTASKVGESHEQGITHDAVFGDITEDGPNYRDIGMFGTAVLMIKSQIGLGVLSIPFTLHALGMVPGVLIIIAIALMTWWSNYVIGVFKQRHPEVYSIDDAAGLMFGRIGKEVFAALFCLLFTFCCGSALLSLSIALNALSLHGACTAVFVVVAAIIAFLFGSIQTLSRISWLAWVGTVSILTAILTVSIAVSRQDRPAAAPTTGVFHSDYKIISSPSFTDAVAAISSIVFSYAGVPAFFNIASEMKDVRHYNKALTICVLFLTSVYLVIGILVYYYCGSYVASPAPGSAGPLVKRVAYGLAFPGLMVSCILPNHYTAKYLFVRFLRDSKHLTANTFTHWAVWLSCTGGVALLAYIIASAIPIFGNLISLVGALMGTILSFQPYGCMWLYDNWSDGKANPTWRWRVMVGWSIFIIVIGSFLMVSGTYASIVAIMDGFKADGGTRPWSCADNSGST